MENVKLTKPCPKCNCPTGYRKSVGPHLGEYCNDCNTWIAWIKQKTVITGVNKKTGEPTTMSLFDEQELKEPSPYDGDDTDDYFDSINIHSLYDDQDLPWED